MKYRCVGCCALALIVIVIGLGCSGDPTKDQLMSGDEAVLVGKDTTVHVIDDRMDDGDPRRAYFVPVGTRVAIVRDDATDKMGSLRRVLVNVREGLQEGRSGLVRRENLRPR